MVADAHEKKEKQTEEKLKLTKRM